MPQTNRGSLPSSAPRRQGTPISPSRTPTSPSTPSSTDIKPSDPRLDLFKPGPYANPNGRVKARSTAQRFSTEEKRKINEAGKKYGCHSCGSKTSGRASGNFTPDHQEVSSHRRDPNKEQYLYPHCQSCSGKQGNFARYLKSMGLNAYDLLDQR